MIEFMLVLAVSISGFLFLFLVFILKNRPRNKSTPIPTCHTCNCHKKALVEKEKLQGIIEISGAICHELSQPIQVISGNSELVLMEILKDNPIYENIRIIKEQAIYMGEITKKLRNITKYQTKEYLKSKIVDIDKASMAG